MVQHVKLIAGTCILYLSKFTLLLVVQLWGVTAIETIKILYMPIPRGQQWRSKNAEKVTHIKGRLLHQAMVLYNYVPFQNGNFS